MGTDPETDSAATQAEMANIAARPFCKLPGKRNGDRSRDCFRRDPGRDGEHSGTSVLQFRQLTTVGDLDLQRVPVQVITIKSTSLKSWSNTFSILNFTITMSQLVNLNGSNNKEDLCQTSSRDSLNSSNGAHSFQVSEFDVLCNRQVLVWGELVEGDTHLLESEANGCKHGGTSVLDFSSTDEITSLGTANLSGQLVPVVFTEEQFPVTDQWCGSKAFDLLLNFKHRSFLTHLGGNGRTAIGRLCESLGG
mmetsp:Transcript_12651/g.16630  ORF Transcript_12651/g.16630 Transcript_12651/m.16630 type:complete len:250 (+) Transcript_12651:2-751(+)